MVESYSLGQLWVPWSAKRDGEELYWKGCWDNVMGVPGLLQGHLRATKGDPYARKQQVARCALNDARALFYALSEARSSPNGLERGGGDGDLVQDGLPAKY